MNDFRATLLPFVFVSSIWKCRASNNTMDCGIDKCQLGYQFCEPEKLICRLCSDFQKTCFQDVLHIANCSSFCKEQLPNPQNDCHRDLLIYLPTAVSVFIICISLGAVIYRRCREYSRVKKKISDADPGSKTNLKEETQPMVVIDNDETQDAGQYTATCISLQGTHDIKVNDSCLDRGCQQFNQISPTNDRPECYAIAINDKILPPRVHDSAGIH